MKPFLARPLRRAYYNHFSLLCRTRHSVHTTFSSALAATQKSLSFLAAPTGSERLSVTRDGDGMLRGRACGFKANRDEGGSSAKKSAVLFHRTSSACPGGADGGP